MTLSNSFYGNNITHTSGKYSGNFEYGTVSGINNLKKEADTTKLNVGKDTAVKNRPAAVEIRNFGVSLPVGAEINSITVEYAHRKVKGSGQKKAPNVLAPTIRLLGWGNAKNPETTGIAPTTTLTSRSVTFNFKPTKAQVESPTFGVYIKYPKNKNDASGYIELKYVRVKINYTAPNYNVSISTPSAYNPPEVGETTEIILSIGNLNRTNYKPSINISLDDAPGVTFDRVIEGNISSSNNRVTWNPQVSSEWIGVNGIFTVYCSSSGTKIIRLSFTLNGVTYSSSCTFTVKPPSVPDNLIGEESTTVPTIDDSISNAEPNLAVVKNYKGYPTVICIDLEGNENFQQFYMKSTIPGLEILDPTQGQWRDWEYDEGEYDSGYISYTLTNANQEYSLNGMLAFVEDGKWYLFVGKREYCKGEIQIFFVDDYEGTDIYASRFNLEFRPKENELTMPFLTIFQLDDEELNRIGNGISYIVESDMKLVSEETYVRDWYKNFRIGVFNNQIESNIEKLATFGSFENDSVTATLNMPDEAVDYDVAGDSEVSLTEGINNIVFTKLDENNEIRTIINCLDEENNIICSGEYFINFEEETITIISGNEYDPTDYAELSIEDIFNNAEYWGEVLSSPNVSEKMTVEFVYDEKYPLYIFFIGDYPEGSPLENVISFTPPIVYEAGSLEDYNSDLYLPLPINNIINSEEEGTLEIPYGKSSNPFTVYGFDVGEIFATGDDLAIRGVVLSMDVEYSDDLILTAILKSPSGKIGTRSFVINGFDSSEKEGAITNKIIIGGTFDLWGFNISDMTDLDDWELTLVLNNPYNTAEGVGTFIFNNLTLSFYYLKIEDEFFVMKVNGEDSRHYAMNLQKIDVSPGLKLDVKYHDIDGSDFNNAYRMNIEPKEIEIEFGVEGCTIQETTELVENISRLLVTKRDASGHPIPNRVEFEHYPGKHWDYILEDPLDTDVESVYYDTKVKLNVPDGTSWANEDTVSSVNGYNDSIVGVNPIIEVQPIGEHVELTETITGQHFNLKRDDHVDGDVITIDCVDREVTLTRYDSELKKNVHTDISDDADYNVDWFVLPVGEFYFDTHGTVSRCTVTFTERG